MMSAGKVKKINPPSFQLLSMFWLATNKRYSPSFFSHNLFLKFFLAARPYPTERKFYTQIIIIIEKKVTQVSPYSRGTREKRTRNKQEKRGRRSIRAKMNNEGPPAEQEESIIREPSLFIYFFFLPSPVHTQMDTVVVIVTTWKRKWEVTNWSSTLRGSFSAFTLSGCRFSIHHTFL